MISTVKRKLNSRGFTLSETMVSVLILALVITLTGGGVMVVKNAYQRITLKAHAQTLMSTTVSKVSEDLRFAEDIDSGDSPEFTDGTTGYRLHFSSDADKGIMCTYTYGDSTRSSALLTDKTMTDGLVPAISYTYDEDSGIFAVAITITRKGTKVSEQAFSVRPLNS